jgi:hypothetical protein
MTSMLAPVTSTFHIAILLFLSVSIAQERSHTFVEALNSSSSSNTMHKLMKAVPYKVPEWAANVLVNHPLAGRLNLGECVKRDIVVW